MLLDRRQVLFLYFGELPLAHLAPVHRVALHVTVLLLHVRTFLLWNFPAGGHHLREERTSYRWLMLDCESSCYLVTTFLSGRLLTDQPGVD